MPLTLRSGIAFTHQRAHACWGQYSGHEYSQKHDRRCGSVGHFRKLYLRVCEMRKFVRKLSLAEIALQRAARGFGRQCLLSVRCCKLARAIRFHWCDTSASRLAKAASTLPTSPSTNTGCEPPHCTPPG